MHDTDKSSNLFRSTGFSNRCSSALSSNATLFTGWGLLRHYWILFKLLLTAIATVILLLKSGPISDLANAAASAAFSSADLIGLRTSVRVHAAGGCWSCSQP